MYRRCSKRGPLCAGAGNSARAAKGELMFSARMFPFAMALVASACGRDKAPAAVADPPRSVSDQGADGEIRWGPWSPPVNLGPVVNSAFNDRHPAISPNDLSLYITS